VQYILELGEPAIAHGVMQNLLGSISSLSVQKFSSNVVEKVLELSNDKMRSKLVEELMSPDRLPRLLQDPYANYVIQKALAVSKKPAFERLVTVIKPHLLARNTAFGKRIQAKLLKKFPDLHVQGVPGSASGAAGAGGQFDGVDGDMNPAVLGVMVAGLSSSNNDGQGRGQHHQHHQQQQHHHQHHHHQQQQHHQQHHGSEEESGAHNSGAPGGMSIQSPVSAGGSSSSSSNLTSTSNNNVPLLSNTPLVLRPKGSYLGAVQHGKQIAAAAAAQTVAQQKAQQQAQQQQQQQHQGEGAAEAQETGAAETVTAEA
jgi:hypothetical protein